MPIIIQSPILPASYPLLEIVQQVCGELGIGQPTFVIGNQDPQVSQLLALLNRLGRDLVKQHNWQMLVKEYQFTTINDVHNYSLPSDWSRQIPQTEWDRSSRWPLIGPLSDQRFQYAKSGIIPQGPRIQFRINQNSVEIIPATGGQDIVFNYISKGWVVSSYGINQDIFKADTDAALFDDSLIITGLKAQWKQAKGLDASFDIAEFRTLLEQCKAQDHSAPKLSLSPTPVSILLSTANIQDGSWPGAN